MVDAQVGTVRQGLQGGAQQAAVRHVHRADEGRFKIRLRHPFGHIPVLPRDLIRAEHPGGLAQRGERAAEGIARAQRVSVGILVGQDQDMVRRV